MTYDKEYARSVLGANCDHCPLGTIGKFVPSVGPSEASIAFVGEAPGIQEAREGVPFIGPSGRLLNAVNAQYGIKREEVFLTNACLCRPPDGTTPAKSAIAACRPRLLNEIRGRESTRVVALGNSASLSVLGAEGVTSLRVGPGRKSPYEGLERARIIPTVHPAACLRQSDMFPSLVADVGKVFIDHASWNPPEWTLHDDPVEAVEFLRRVQERGADVVIDIEVDIEKDTALDHPDRYDLLCNGIGLEEDDPEDDEIHVIGERALADDKVLDAMADALAASRLTAQNGKFDLAGLYPTLGALTLDFDTMLASYGLDERPRVHGLKYRAIEDLGMPQYDSELAQYVKGATDEELEGFSGYGRIPRDLLYKYNAYDIYATLKIKRILKAKMERSRIKPSWWDETWHWDYKDLFDLHEHLIMGSNGLMYLELNGICIDRKYNLELYDELEASCNKIEDELNSVLVKAGYNPINPRSPKQVMGALEFFQVRAPNTAEETLKRLLDQYMERYGDEAYDKPPYQFADILLKHRREAKMFGTYVKGIRKRIYKGRIYSSFNMMTTTGRLSSRNPNIQNIPRRSVIKKQFVPKTNPPPLAHNVFVNADYKQAELRCLSWLAQDTFFRDILDDPTRDLFDELTPKLFGPNIHKGLVGTKIDKEIWSDIRVRVKAFVYGLNYGRHYTSIAQELKMSVDEAKFISDNFFSTIPEIVEFQERVQSEIKAGHDLISPFGRHRRFHLITKENWINVKNEALAFLPQSTSSDICLRAMARVREDLKGSGAFVRNIVHDNILVDSPPDVAQDVVAILDKRMFESGQELVGDYIRFETDIKIGNHWGEV